MSEPSLGVAVPETRLHPIYLIIGTAKTLRQAIPMAFNRALPLASGDRYVGSEQAAQIRSHSALVTLTSYNKSLLPRDFEASKFELTARPFDTHQ